MGTISDDVQVEGAEVVFGPFRLLPVERRLLRDGQPVDIGGRALDLLVALVERPGRVLTKRDIIRRVWPDVVVEEGSLRFHMTSLRKILGDGEAGARYIATQVGVGYAFVAPVQRVFAEASMPLATPVHGGLVAGAGRLPRRARLIGRANDVARVLDRLGTSVLYTIAGAGGVGKTSLAVEVGHRLVDEGRTVRFVDLAQVEDPALVPFALASALEIPVQTDDPVSVLIAHLRASTLLIVVDNCEHVVDAASVTLERVRSSAPGVGILATSREPLRATDEHVHWLDPLAFPAEGDGVPDDLLAFPAMELFIERARAGSAMPEPGPEDRRLIADICRRLDGMALPIELAALRVGTHGVAATHAMLGERFSLGWSGRRTAAPRQQTLRATLDWSYELLSTAERLAFDRLSVFVGPFSFDATAHVLADARMDADTAIATLDALAAKGLVAVDRGVAAGSFRLLEMTRAYARERMARHGDAEVRALQRRHAAYFLRVLDSLGETGEEAVRESMRLSCQFGNVRSALEWSFGPQGESTIAIPLATVSSRLFLRFSFMAECRTWCERALNLLGMPYVGTAVEFELQAALGLVRMFTLGNTDATGVALRRALEIAQALDRPWDQLRILGRLQIYEERLGDFAASLAWAELATEVGRAIDEPEAIAVAASLAGVSQHLLGDQAAARRSLELSLRYSLPSELSRTIHYGFDHRNRSCIALARTLWLQGHADQARHWVHRALREAVALDHPVTHCIALIWTLSVHIWTGEIDRVKEALSTFSVAANANIFRPYIAAADGFQGIVQVLGGCSGRAVDTIRDSLARLKAMRYELLTTTFEIALTEALLSSDRPLEAQELVEASIAHCERTGEAFALPELLRLKAAVSRRLGASDSTFEETLQRALDLATAQSASAWALRCAMDLARHWRSTSRHAEADALLVSYRDAFVEGADTRDLRELGALMVDVGAGQQQGDA